MKTPLRRRRGHHKNKVVIIKINTYCVAKCRVRERWQYTPIPNDPAHMGYCLNCGGRM